MDELYQEPVKTARRRFAAHIRRKPLPNRTDASFADGASAPPGSGENRIARLI